MLLRSFLIRLVWLCVLPLLVLAVYMAVDTIKAARHERDVEATNLARNLVVAIDQNLRARIGALNMLAVSPLIDDPERWSDLYQEAQGFLQSFGSHVILADGQHMHFSTRQPYGTALPAMFRPPSHAALPAALETGGAAVSDLFISPVTKEEMISIALPSERRWRETLVVMTVVEARQYQHRLEQVALPVGWAISLIDGAGTAIARRGPSTDVDGDDGTRRYVMKSDQSAWSVVLEIPGEIYRAPLISGGLALMVGVVVATLTGAIGGLMASRRLGDSVAALAEDSAGGGGESSGIAELAAVRRMINNSTERREAAEHARDESEKRFRATFEQAAVGIALVAPDGRWLKVNQRLCDIVGYSHDELLGGSFQDITHPDDLAGDVALAQRVLAGEIANYTIEKRYRHKQEHIVWVNLTVTLVRYDDGTPDYFISVIEDIGRRKGAEAALQELNASLEQRVEQRTAELTLANKELDSFAYAVSHDLRAPLRAMNGFSQALLEDYGGSLDGEAKGYLDQICLASRKMGDLIDGVLALSRSARGELRSDDIDVSRMATTILADLARVEPERQVAVDIEPGLAVCGDERMIDAALRNLLGNAWKYTSKTAAPRIRVHAGELDGRPAICVSDNGAGFDMAYAERLFQPFRRLHRNDEFPGIGIGLATVQRIVRRHGGEIRARAELGKGATFCFTLGGERPIV